MESNTDEAGAPESIGENKIWYLKKNRLFANVPVDAVERLCSDIVDNFDATGGITGSFESTESLLLKTLTVLLLVTLLESTR